MRLDKLARQLRAHQKATAKAANGTQKRLRDEVADLDDRIGKQIEALEQGSSRSSSAKRIEKLRRAKEAAEIELRALTPASADSEASEDPAALLARIPDLADALRQAPTELKRQVFEAFCLQITYDKPSRRIEISATITEAIADALENAQDLPQEVSSVAQRDIAGGPIRPSERRPRHAGVSPGGLNRCYGLPRTGQGRDSSAARAKMPCRSSWSREIGRRDRCGGRIPPVREC